MTSCYISVRVLHPAYILPFFLPHFTGASGNLLSLRALETLLAAVQADRELNPNNQNKFAKGLLGIKIPLTVRGIWCFFYRSKFLPITPFIPNGKYALSKERANNYAMLVRGIHNCLKYNGL